MGKFVIPLFVILAGVAATDLSAQTVPPAQEPPKIGATLTADVLRDLPAGANLFAILETVQPEIIADRFNSGGLNAGAPSGISGFLASWTQTQYRLGDVNISSPIDGAPLLFPDVAFWDRIEVMTGAMAVGSNAPGLGVTLQPHRPSTQWTGTIEASASGGQLISDSALHRPPPILGLHDWARGAAIAMGPVVGRRLGLSVGSTWTRNTTFERAESSRRRSEVGSAFAHAVLTLAPNTEWRALGWAQRAQTIAGQDRSIHIQSTYDQYGRDRRSWRIFGAYTQRRRAREHPVSGLVVDRLVDGPILALVADNGGTERRWSLGARVSPTRPRGRHEVHVGTEVEGTAARAPSSFAGLIGELVDGHPARVWAFKSQAITSQRQATTIAGYATDRIAVSPRMTLDLALRFESIQGKADGATTAVSWQTLMPSATVQWKLGTPYILELMTGYRRSGNQLLLGLLAHGDPAAPVADVFRWDGSLAATGPLIAHAGPGTGGDPAFSRIDPDLKRSYIDEFVISLESRPQSTLRLSVAGIARRQSSLVNVVNTGVPMSGYETFTVRDDNVDLFGAADDHELPVHNRLPESFGRDQYLLTNTGQQAATMGAVVLTAQRTTERLFLSIGATASAAIGSGGNRGFHATENDQDASGELLTNPNASTFAHGRLFSDRAYVIKWTTVYRFPSDVRLGAIARYQDGQPFSRIVVVPGLNQGAEAIQAFANGRSRFAFTGTLDIRLQKGFAIGATRLDAILDTYNLLNMTKEVEEYVVTGDRFRETTAVQPPRALHLGVRLSF